MFLISFLRTVTQIQTSWYTSASVICSWIRNKFIAVLCVTAEGGSPPSISSSEGQEEGELSKVPAIDNSELCIPEPSSSKKLPSLTNEGTQWV